MAESKTAIIARFKVSDVAAQLNTTAELVTQSIINTLEYVGEECVRHAREHGSYNDITGNLRSSVGYVVLRAGKIVKQSTPKSFSGSQGNGSDGVKQGDYFLQKLYGSYPTGLVLIITAGMNYAAYVENIHGKDVIASASQKAEKLVPELLAKIGIKK